MKVESRKQPPEREDSPRKFPSAAGQKTNRFDIAQVFAGLEKGIETPPKGLGYALWAGIVLLLMVLLPCIYVALIGLTGYGVYYHLVNHHEMLQVRVRGKGYLFILLAYVAPAIIGGLIALFMLKPLLARPQAQKQGYELDPQREPILYEFIRRVCDAVGAPQPGVIELTMDVNAAAGPRKGLFSLIQRDLRLVIGIPLVAGTTVQQLGGVLAHEFGHFSQSTGMILSNLIHRINIWFLRVVFERDAWDDWLTSTAKQSDIRIGWVLHLGRLGVWLSRKILHGLMLMGWAVSGRFSQHMEFDADRYETQLAGSDNFKETSLLLPVLATGHQMIIPTIRESLSRREIVDDFPRLIVEQVKLLTPEQVDQIKKNVLDQQTRWIDTHPSTRDRIDSALKETAAGILQANAPASVLFRDFDRFCLAFTKHYFQTEVELDLSNFTVTQAGQMLAAEQEQTQRQNQAVDYTTVAIPLSRPIQWGEEITETLHDPQLALPELKRLRSKILKCRPAAIDAHSNYSRSQRAVTATAMALAYHECGLAAEKKLKQSEWETIESTRKDLEAKLQSVVDAVPALAEYERLLGRRVTLGLRVWQAIVDGPKREQLADWLKALRQFDELRPELFRMQVSQTKQEYILSTFGKYLEDERIVRGIQRVNKELVAHVRNVFSELSAIPHPFSESTMSIADSLVDELPPLSDPFVVFRLSEMLGEHADSIQARLMLNLLSFAAEGEKSLGLEPLPQADLPAD